MIQVRKGDNAGAVGKIIISEMSLDYNFVMFLKWFW